MGGGGPSGGAPGGGAPGGALGVAGRCTYRLITPPLKHDFDTDFPAAEPPATEPPAAEPRAEPWAWRGDALTG